MDVEDHQEMLARLIILHKEASDEVKWAAARSEKAPRQPTKRDTREQNARAERDSYRPGVLDKVLRRTEAKMLALRRAVDAAPTQDEDEFRRARAEYESDLSEWRSQQQLSEKVVSGDVEGYREALTLLNPFEGLEEIGTVQQVEVVDPKLAVVDLQVHNENIIPTESKSLLKSGKLSVKQMPKGRVSSALSGPRLQLCNSSSKRDRGLAAS
jgi:hypothetical protein